MKLVVYLQITCLTRSVPDADSLVERRRHNEVLLGVEGRAHDIVIVARKNRYTCARLPVPDADSLVVRCRDDPRVLVVELHGPDVVEMTQEREEASSELVIPHFHLH